MFDKLQHPSVQTHVLTAELNFPTEGSERRLPVGVYRARIDSTTLAISDKSNVTITIGADLTRSYMIHLDWLC